MTPTFNTIVVAVAVALIGGFVPSDTYGIRSRSAP